MSGCFVPVPLCSQCLEADATLIKGLCVASKAQQVPAGGVAQQASSQSQEYCCTTWTAWEHGPGPVGAWSSQQL